MTTAAEGGAAGKTAVTPVFATSVSSNDTHAELGALAASTAVEGVLSVTARHEGSVDTRADGDTESGDTGVGISLALSIATDTAQATAARDLVAGGAMSFNARSTGSNKSGAKASVSGGSETPQGSEDTGGVNNLVTGRSQLA